MVVILISTTKKRYIVAISFSFWWKVFHSTRHRSSSFRCIEGKSGIACTPPGKDAEPRRRGHGLSCERDGLPTAVGWFRVFLGFQFGIRAQGTAHVFGCQVECPWALSVLVLDGFRFVPGCWDSSASESQAWAQSPKKRSFLHWVIPAASVQHTLVEVAQSRTVGQNSRIQCCAVAEKEKTKTKNERPPT